MSRLTLNLVYGLAVLALSVALVVLTFQRVGSPGYRAQVVRDKERMADVLEIVNRLHNVGVNKRPVPARLADDPQTDVERKEWVDPLTKKPYAYRKLDDRRYEIRVTFELPSSALETEGLTLPDGRWRHRAGEHRMEFTVKDKDSSSWEYR